MSKEKCVLICPKKNKILDTIAQKIDAINANGIILVVNYGKPLSLTSSKYSFDSEQGILAYLFTKEIIPIFPTMDRPNIGSMPQDPKDLPKTEDNGIADAEKVFAQDIMYVPPRSAYDDDDISF